MQSVVSADLGDRSLAARSAERAVAARYSAYLEEVERLIRAGVAVMERTQSTNPRVSEIVREAGLSNQAFYRHFRSKDELLVAILDDGLRQLVGYLTHQMEKEPTGLGKVRRWVEGILAQATNPAAARATRGVILDSVRLAELFPDESRRSEDVLKAPLREAIALAVERGELTHADPERDAEAIYRLGMGSMQAFISGADVPSLTDVAHVVAFSLGGIGAAVRSPDGA